MIDDSIGSLWVLWVISWLFAARWSGRTVKTTRPGERSLELLLTLGGAVALMSPGMLGSRTEINVPLYSLGTVAEWLLVTLVTCGFVFCWWARIHLGKMWSANITLKEAHRIIDTGPYALVRHPIYSGVLLSAWATAAARGTEQSFLGAALMTVGFYLKARREEQLLLTELGAPYEAYRRRVPMLLPGAG